MSRLFSVALLAAAFLLTACAHNTEVPVVVTKDVLIAVPVPCTVDTKNKRPQMYETAKELWAALQALPDVDSRAQLVTTQLLAHMGWLPVVEGAMQGCEMVPKRNTP